MLMNMSDLDIIFSPTYSRVVFMRPLIEYDNKMNYRVQISQCEILNLFVAIEYTRVSRNVILDYIRAKG